MVCIYKNITETDRDKYQNLVFVEIPISKAILTESVQQAKMWLMNYGLSSQQKKKLNKNTSELWIPSNKITRTYESI